ncbi:unnamed protein product [Rotaria magnacalcarata]|uniref:WD repeat-containing protein 36 n=1 Tax=Rotaria magnacalcarata TaxID=392030 RepID=A0A8S2JMI7_9BILA|nr:unnamed protein product [Rotaria magnacalcarata]
MLSTTSKDQKHLFSSYRALGLVTNHVPCILRIHQRHSSHLLLTAIGKVFHAYRLNTLQVLLVSDAHPEDIQVLASNSRLVFAAAGSTIYVYRRVFHLHQTLTDHKSDIKHLLPFGDEHLVSVDESNTLRVWDIQSGSVYLSLEFNTQNFHITSLLHPATYVNKLLVTSRQDDGPIKFAAKNPSKRLKSSPYATAHSFSLCGISFDSLNTRLISCDSNGNIKLWRLKTKTLISSSSIINQENSDEKITITKMIVHRDSGLIALAFNDYTIKIFDFDTMTCKCIRTFKTNSHKEEITALAFMPDARWLLSTSLDKTMRIWDIPSGQLIDTIEFDQAIITIAVSPNGDMLATGHTDALGVYLWSNRSMYDSSIIRTTNDVDNQELLVGDFQSAEQISKNLLTLSTLPESKWKNLLVLDTIRQRNKPKEAINIPKQAPFFLPTVSNLRGFVFINPDDEDEKNKKQSRIHQIQKFLHESSLTNFLDRQKASSTLSIDVISHLKDLGMAKIEYELRCLSPEQGGSLERMFKFIDILNQALDEKQNYDLVSSYLALFIQLHGTSFIWKNDELIEQIRKIQLKQKETWLNIQRQLNTSIALVKYIKSVTTI